MKLYFVYDDMYDSDTGTIHLMEAWLLMTACIILCVVYLNLDNNLDEQYKQCTADTVIYVSLIAEHENELNVYYLYPT